MESLDMRGLCLKERQEFVKWYLINSEVLRLKATFKALEYLESLPDDSVHADFISKAFKRLMDDVADSTDDEEEELGIDSEELEGYI